MREKGLCNSVIGYGRKEGNLLRAKARGIIDDYRLDAAAAAEGADIVVLATPVGILGTVASDIRAALKKGSIVTDVGSVKGALVSYLESLMPEGVRFIVPILSQAAINPVSTTHGQPLQWCSMHRDSNAGL